MPVFKTSMKIVRSKLPILLIYVFVIVMIAVLMMATVGDSGTASGSFAQEGCAVTVLNHDAGGTLSEGLRKFLFQTNREVTVEENTEALQDALYYENTEYILTIPEGFTETFLKGEKISLSTTSLPDSTERYYVDMQIDRYLNAARFYVQAGLRDADEIISLLEEDMTVSAEAEVISEKADGSRLHIQYFNYLSYSMMALMIFGIGTILISFQQKDLYRRNLCAPIRTARMSGELILSAGVFAAVCCFLLIGCGLALYWNLLWTSGVLGLLCLNFTVFSIVGVGIGFLCGVLVKNYNVQSAVANVVTLSMSFLCGVFVPQDIMSPAVLKISQFLPAYWYVRGNELIGSLNAVSAETLEPVFMCMGIQLLFAAAVFALALMISRKRRVTVS